MPNLVTPAEVMDTTGKSVDAKAIAVAQGVVATMTGRDLSGDTSSYRARDLRLLGLAVAWQTSYLDDHPDLVNQLGNLTAAATNGNSVSFGDGGSAGALLAPLAEAALKRLSWRRSRAVRLRRAPERSRVQTLVHDGADGDWRPLR